MMAPATRRVATYPGNDTTDRYGDPMDPTALIDYLRDGLRRSGHPAIGQVEDLDTPGVRMTCPDGIKVFAKVAWTGRTDQRPAAPSWPSREDLTRAGTRR